MNKEGEPESTIPWGRKNPEQSDCDVTQTGRKNFLSSRERWPDAQIPYEISSTYSTCLILRVEIMRTQPFFIIFFVFSSFEKAPEQRQIIAFGMKAFHNKTCVRFVRRTTEKNYIRIKKTGKGYVTTFSVKLEIKRFSTSVITDFIHILFYFFKNKLLE